jgi:hypothetical protein
VTPKSSLGPGEMDDCTSHDEAWGSWPEDVVEDLRRVAPRLGFSGYQPLMRAYIGHGLRQDLARLEGESNINALIESLQRHGVGETVIADALSEIRNGDAVA